MRDQDDGVGVARQVFLEPVARVEIEVVGGLVQQQQVWPAQQQLRQRDAHLPAARERLGGAIGVGGAEPQPAQHRGDAQIHAVAVAEAEPVLQVGIPRQQAVVLRLGQRGVRQPVLDVGHLRLHVEQGLERASRLLEHGAARMGQAVLGQVADGQVRRLGNHAPIGLVEARQHLEQRGLAGAVRAAQADAVAVPDLPGDAVQEGADAEGFGDF